MGWGQLLPALLLHHAGPNPHGSTVQLSVAVARKMLPVSVRKTTALSAVMFPVHVFQCSWTDGGLVRAVTTIALPVCTKVYLYCVSSLMVSRKGGGVRGCKMKGVFLSIDYRSQIQACSHIAACHWPERLHSEVDSIPSCTARRAERKAIKCKSYF